MFVEVHQRSTLVRLPVSRVSLLVDADPHFIEVLSFFASAHADMIVESLFAMTTRNLRKRVAQKIISCARATTGVRFDATQYELADMTSASRNSVNRVLQELDREKLINIGYGHITINDIERLQNVAES